MKKLKYILALALLLVSVLSFSACGIKEIDKEDIYKIPEILGGYTKLEKVENKIPEGFSEYDSLGSWEIYCKSINGGADTEYKIVSEKGAEFTKINQYQDDDNYTDIDFGYVRYYQDGFDYQNEVKLFPIEEIICKDGEKTYFYHYYGVDSTDPVFTFEEEDSVWSDILLDRKVGNFYNCGNDFYRIDENNKFVKLFSLGVADEKRNIIKDIRYIGGDYFFYADDESNVFVYDKELNLVCFHEFSCYEYVTDFQVLSTGDAIFQTVICADMLSDDYTYIDPYGNKIITTTYKFDSKIKNIVKFDFDYAISSYIPYSRVKDIVNDNYCGFIVAYPIVDKRLMENSSAKVYIALDKEGNIAGTVEKFSDSQTSWASRIKENLYGYQTTFGETFLVDGDGNVILELAESNVKEVNNNYILSKTGRLFNEKGESFDLISIGGTDMEFYIYENNIALECKKLLYYTTDDGKSKPKMRTELYLFKDGSLTPELIGVVEELMDSSDDEKYNESTIADYEFSKNVDAYIIITLADKENDYYSYTVYNEYNQKIGEAFTDSEEKCYDVSFYGEKVDVDIYDGLTGVNETYSLVR